MPLERRIVKTGYIYHDLTIRRSNGILEALCHYYTNNRQKKPSHYRLGFLFYRLDFYFVGLKSAALEDTITDSTISNRSRSVRCLFAQT